MRRMLTANHRHREEMGGGATTQKWFREASSNSSKCNIHACSEALCHLVSAGLYSIARERNAIQSNEKYIYIVIQLGSLFSSAGALHFKVRPVLCVEIETVTRGRRKSNTAKYSFKCLSYQVGFCGGFSTLQHTFFTCCRVFGFEKKIKFDNIQQKWAVNPTWYQAYQKKTWIKEGIFCPHFWLRSASGPFQMCSTRKEQQHISKQSCYQQIVGLITDFFPPIMVSGI